GSWWRPRSPERAEPRRAAGLRPTAVRRPEERSPASASGSRRARFLLFPGADRESPATRSDGGASSSGRMEHEMLFLTRQLARNGVWKAAGAYLLISALFVAAAYGVVDLLGM